MLRKRSNRNGISLPEVLVTVAIMAVLAAIVIPAVTQQIGAADAPAFQASVNSLRTAITSFAADVRKFPGELAQLSTDIDDANPPTEEDLATTRDGGTAYTENVVDRWRGPYENSGASLGAILLGYGWTTEDDLVDSLGYIVVTLTKTGAVTQDAIDLDAIVDAGGIGASAGIIRWVDNAGALDDPNKIKLFLMSSAR